MRSTLKHNLIALVLLSASCGCHGIRSGGGGDAGACQSPQGGYAGSQGGQIPGQPGTQPSPIAGSEGNHGGAGSPDPRRTPGGRPIAGGDRRSRPGEGDVPPAPATVSTVGKNDSLTDAAEAARGFPKSLQNLFSHIPTGSVEEQNKVTELAQKRRESLEYVASEATYMMSRQVAKRMNIRPESPVTVALLPEPDKDAPDYRAYPITEPTVSKELCGKIVEKIPDDLKLRGYSSLKPEHPENSSPERLLKHTIMTLLSQQNRTEVRLQVFQANHVEADGKTATDSLMFATANMVELMAFAKTLSRQNPTYWNGPQGGIFKEFLQAAAMRQASLLNAAATSGAGTLPNARRIFGAYTAQSPAILADLLQRRPGGPPEGTDPRVAEGEASGE